jgi:6-phosphofructokinase
VVSLLSGKNIPTAHTKIRLGGIGPVLAQLIEEATSIECRATVLGHLQRGGSPSASDRVLATRYGVKTAQLAMAGQHGLMVCLKGQDIETVPLNLVARGTRTVPAERPTSANSPRFRVFPWAINRIRLLNAPGFLRGLIIFLVALWGIEPQLPP